MRGRTGHNLHGINKSFTGDTTVDLFVLTHTTCDVISASSWQHSVEGGNKLAVFLSQHVLDHVVAENLTDVDDIRTQFVDILHSARRHDPVKHDAVAWATDVKVDRKCRKRKRHGRWGIWFFVNHLHRLVGIDLSVEFVIGDGEWRHDPPIEPIFTHLGAREVVNCINGLLLHAGGIELLEESLVEQLDFLLGGHIGTSVVL